MSGILNALVGSFALGKPEVTGGILTSDATFYYRSFSSNGTLSVSKAPLIADVLVVGGGLAGFFGRHYQSGKDNSYLFGNGGGGGDVRLFSNLSVSTGNTAVTIGAGTSSWTTNNNSSFGSNASIGSSGAGGYFFSGQSPASMPGSPATPGSNGNAGGNAANSAGGGGGGIAGVGQNASAFVGGNGGDGTNAYASWSNATGFGVSGRFGAGGGGGGFNSRGFGGAGGGGNGSVQGDGSGIGNPGQAQTGSGGGGGTPRNPNVSNSGGNGGSGVIIVRYTRAQVD